MAFPPAARADSVHPSGCSWHTSLLLVKHLIHGALLPSLEVQRKLCPHSVFKASWSPCPTLSPLCLPSCSVMEFPPPFQLLPSLTSNDVTPDVCSISWWVSLVYTQRDWCLRCGWHTWATYSVEQDPNLKLSEPRARWSPCDCLWAWEPQLLLYPKVLS